MMVVGEGLGKASQELFAKGVSTITRMCVVMAAVAMVKHFLSPLLVSSAFHVLIYNSLQQQ